MCSYSGSRGSSIKREYGSLLPCVSLSRIYADADGVGGGGGGVESWSPQLKAVDDSFAAGMDCDISLKMNSNRSGGGGSFASAHDFLQQNPAAGNAVFNSDLYWEMNYHEAAIFLEEGRNNEKFESHPRHAEDLPAYLLVHNSWYYGLDLLTSCILLGLAFVEAPAVPLFQLPVWAHGLMELVALATIGIELVLKLRWIGWGTMLKHKRTMLKCITLIIMFVEALVVLARQSTHFRVTRALRPIFLVDTRYCGGVRRFIRQILQTLPPIVDMLGLLLFFILTYMVLGYYLFSEHNVNFTTLQDSFVSLFVLLTTANFPDVMMPSFARNKWYAIYFVSYLCTMLYVMMNLLLAVVNETFTAAERDKFKKLFLHKRKAAQHAFKLLVSRQNPNCLRFKQFEGLMRYYAPHKPIRDVVLMFQYLNVSGGGGGCGSGTLSWDQFLNVYDATVLTWEPQYSSIPWYHGTWLPFQILCQGAFAAISWPYFESCVYSVIVGNGIAMVWRLLQQQQQDQPGQSPALSVEQSAHDFAAGWDTLLFTGLFATEALIKVLGLGVRRYLSSGWNLFDLGTLTMVLMAAVGLLLCPSAVFLVLFRPLRMLRLFKAKKRYRDVFGTLVILSPLMCSTAIVMLVLYYFFAVIGMELFAGYDMRNCCRNTTVEDFYKYSANESTSLGYYYLNTFDNLMASGMTLFELTVVNNWFILMNAYAVTVGMYTRAYFMIFYLSTMIVLTIVVSSFLEAFRFRIQYKKSTTKRDEEKMLHEQVELNWMDLQRSIIDQGAAAAEEEDEEEGNEQQREQLTARISEFLSPGSTQTFIGSRPRTREILQRRMYTQEIKEWLLEATTLEGLDSVCVGGDGVGGRGDSCDGNNTSNIAATAAANLDRNGGSEHGPSLASENIEIIKSTNDAAAESVYSRVQRRKRKRGQQQAASSLAKFSNTFPASPYDGDDGDGDDDDDGGNER